MFLNRLLIYRFGRFAERCYENVPRPFSAIMLTTAWHVGPNKMANRQLETCV